MSQAKLSRQLGLVAYLLDQDEPVTFKDVREALTEYGAGSYEAAVRKFERDKDELRSIGVPLETCAREDVSDSQDAYRIDRSRFVLPPLKFSPEEYLTLQVVGGAARSAAGFPLHDSLTGALIKLSCRAGFNLLEEDDDTYLRLHWDPRREQQATFVDPILQAIRQRKKIVLSYQSAGADPVRERTVLPYGLFSVGSLWYLVGYCQLREDLRVFRLSRIHNLDVPGQRTKKREYEIPADFNLDDYRLGPPWSLGEGPGTTMHVRLSEDIAWRIDDRLQEAGTVTDNDDGSVDWHVDVKDRERFRLWLLSLGPGAQLAGPPAEVSAMRQQVETLAQRYTTAATGAARAAQEEHHG